MATTVKTELEWQYEPPDFFEAPLCLTLARGRVRIEAGTASFEFASPTDPLPSALRDSVSAELRLAFQLRQILTGKVFALRGAVETQHRDSGKRTVAVGVGISVVAVAGFGDATVTDADGNVISDTRTDRIN